MTDSHYHRGILRGSGQERYQDECADVLDAYWNGETASRIDGAPNTLPVEINEYVELLRTSATHWREKAGMRGAKRTYRGKLTDAEKAQINRLAADLSMSKTDIAQRVGRPLPTISARIDGVRDRHALA